MTRHLTCMYEGRIDGTASSGEKKCDWRGPFWKWRRRFAWNSASRSKHRPDWIWWAERERKSAGWRRNKKKKKEMRMQMWSSYRSASSQFDYIAGNYQWAASLPLAAISRASDIKRRTDAHQALCSLAVSIARLRTLIGINIHVYVKGTWMVTGPPTPNNGHCFSSFGFL